jgi:hypothetical protein
MAKFTINPRDFVQGAIENIEEVRRRYALEIFSRVVERTPVDTGAARGNWIPSIGSPSEEITDNKDKSGNQTLQKIKAVVEQVKGDDSLFLSNNLPYLPKLEYGGYGDGPKTINGFSKQAPHGMAGVTVAQAGQIFQEVVNAIKGGGA